MPEFLTNFSTQITEYWNKFTRVQKLQIIGIALAGLAALVVLTLVLSRPNYVVFKEGVSLGQMNTIKSTLDEANIAFEINEDATTISVESGKYTDASLALADQGVLPSTGVSWREALIGTSLTSSSTEKRMLAQLALETELAEIISLMSAVETARVKVVLPLDNSSVLQQDKESSVSVMLQLNDELKDDQILGIASYLEGEIENLSIGRVRIMDANNSKLIFNGASSDGIAGNLTSYMEVEMTMEAQYAAEIENVLLSGTEYNDATASVNLKMDFDEVSTQTEEHTTPEGLGESLPTRTYVYESTGASTEGGGPPGTDSNADTTSYAIDNGSGTESTVAITEKEFDVNTTVTNTIKSIGTVIPEESTVTVTLNKFVYHKENLLEEQGLLDETSWEQYQEDYGAITSIEVDPTTLEVVSNTANIDDVVIVAYEVPIFEATPIAENQMASYIPVIIIVLMIALLGYAVYKGTEPVDITEVEPELSVEDMLATTQVADELEAIEFGDKSEARVQIEKFVDENPEAVAQLLRNWLNEDWE